MKTDQLNAYNGTLNNDSSLYGEINSASLLLHGFSRRPRGDLSAGRKKI